LLYVGFDFFEAPFLVRLLVFGVDAVALLPGSAIATRFSPTLLILKLPRSAVSRYPAF